jgi:DNA-binding response OmpR family regulator
VEGNFSSEIKRHVLIVDDEPAVRRTVRSVLESAGYECSESENGAAALTWLNDHQADVVIADYQMPVMSGLKLLERIKSTMNGKTPKVIMLSGVIQDREKYKALNLGAFTIIDKPCNFRELVVKVNEAVGL